MPSQLVEQLSTVTPVVPVQRYVQRPLRQQLDQLAAGQLLAHLQLRHHTPAEAGTGQAYEAFRGGAQVVGEAAADAETGEKVGPLRPRRMLSCPGSMLMMVLGT